MIKWFASLCAVGALWLAAPAFAQDAYKAERIEVTGSNIKRIQTEGALPVQVITKDQIDLLTKWGTGSRRP